MSDPIPVRHARTNWMSEVKMTQLDSYPFAALRSRQLPDQRQPANSVARNERVGQTAETEVVVSDTVDRSCCRGTRLIPFETTTFFARINGQGKKVMKRVTTSRRSALPTNLHLDITPDLAVILDGWRSRYFNKNADISDVAHYAMCCALHHPGPFESWLTRLVRYCEAEGIPQREFIERCPKR